MGRAQRKSATVGVRELRQNLSVYLERVKKGEALTVTERGAAVAILRPLPRSSSTLDRLVAEGRATPPARPLRQLRPAVSVALDTPLSVILDAIRADRL